VIVDKGYQSVELPGVQILRSGQRRGVTRTMKAMIKRKELVRKGTPEADAMADRILEAVERKGGLTAEEVYALQVY
jgi:hypothetical protein